MHFINLDSFVWSAVPTDICVIRLGVTCKTNKDEDKIKILIFEAFPL